MKDKGLAISITLYTIRMTKKERRTSIKKNKTLFMDTILPIIESNGFDIVRHPHFIKIKISNEWVDYYPGSERLFRKTKSIWYDLPIKILLKKLQIAKQP